MFNKLEYQIKSFKETRDATLSFTNEQITDCFIKEFQEVLIAVRGYLGADAYYKMVLAGNEPS